MTPWIGQRGLRVHLGKVSKEVECDGVVTSLGFVS